MEDLADQIYTVKITWHNDETTIHKGPWCDIIKTIYQAKENLSYRSHLWIRQNQGE